MSITDEMRRYGGTVLEQSKVALDEARKPWLAAVGATDLAYGQLKELPTEVQARIRRLQSGTGQVDAAHVRDAVERATTQARGAYEAYMAQARETYETLAHRGELVVRRLRRSPEVRSAFDQAEELLDRAETAVEQADEKVTRPAGAAPKRAPAKRGSTAS